MNENEEKKAADFFPFTRAQEEEAKTDSHFFPSMGGRGYDPVELTREDIFNDIGRGAQPGQDGMLLKELPQFLADKFRFSAESGTLAKTYGHYVSEMKRTKVLDDKVIQAFERFLPTVQEATTVEEQREVFQEISNYLRKLQMTKKI